MTVQTGESDDFVHAWRHVGDILGTDLAGLKSDVAVLKTDVAVLKTDVKELRGQMTRLEDSMHRGFNRIDARLDQLVALIVRDETRPR